MPCQTTAHHKPISSPNTWLISGAVKVAAGADAAGPLPVAVLRIGLADAHILIDRHGAVAPDALAQSCEQRSLAVVNPSVGHWPMPARACRP